MNTNKAISFLKSILLFGILVVITFYFVFRGINIKELLSLLKTVDIKYIIIALLCMLVYFCLDSTNIRRVLVSLKNKISFKKAFKYSLVGFFFSSITPSSTGGQPMQLYYMNKDKVEISNATITCLINLACFQITLIGLAIISILLEFKIFLSCAIGIKIMIIVGILLNSCVLFFCLSALFSKNLIIYIVKFVIKILKLFKYSKADNVEKKLMDEVSKYRECSNYIKNNNMIFIKNVITAFFQLVLFHSIPYFVYRSFGLSGQTFISFVALEELLYVSTSALPSPGAVGVSELNFMYIYKMLFPVEMLGSAMLLSRGINFYFYVLFSGLFLIIDYIKHKTTKQNITNL